MTTVRKISLVLLFVLMLAPVWFMFVGSFQDTKGAMHMPPDLVPVNGTSANYERIASLPLLGTWTVNTLVVVGATVILSVLLSCMGGYVFAFYRFRFKEVLWAILLVGMMIPRIAVLIPLYVVVKQLGLSGTLAAVVLPCVFAPFGMYLARTYFESVPLSLLDAARVDGASEWQILVKVVMPISAPIVAALSVFAAVGALQDYIWQALVLQMPERQTLLIGLMRAALDRGGGDLNLNVVGKLLAVGCVLLAPLLVVFLAANKYFVSKIEGATKE